MAEKKKQLWSEINNESAVTQRAQRTAARLAKKNQMRHC
jgi:hypothetical protein